MANSFTVTLKTLTPVHIGSGDTINKLDYFIEGDRFHRVNMDSLFADPEFAALRDKFLESAPGGQPIDRLVPEDLLQRHILYTIPIHPSARNTNQIEVRLFIKSAGRVYIPGSSLKGAILSALCWDVLKDRKEAAERVIAGYEKTDNQGRKKHVYDDPIEITLETIGGRSHEILGEFTHWLDVSDSDFKTPQESLQLSLARVEGARRRGRIPILYETIKPGIQFTFTLKLDPASKLTPQSLIQKVNDFYQRVAQKDSPNIPAPASTGLIRLGQGSGKFATSLLILAQELNLNHRYSLPRTRKRINSSPMGWAQMEVI